MTLDEILTKKEELTAENKKNRVLIEETQQKIDNNRKEIFKLTQEENKLLYKNRFDPGAYFIKIDISGSYHADIFTIYRILSTVANGTIVKFDTIVYRINDWDYSLLFKNGGQENVKTITNDGFMFIEAEKAEKVLNLAMQLKTKELIEALIEIKNTCGQE